MIPPKFSIFYTSGDVVHGGGEEDELVPVYFSKKWLEAPCDGVSHINVEVHEVGRVTLKENEYYYQLPLNSHGKGYIAGSMKLGAFLRQALNIGTFIKFGGYTETENYRALAKRAMHDDWVPRQTGNIATNEEDQAD